MKKYIIGFTAAILICALAVGALAATGKLTIEVNTDMKIQVNGNVFAPTDVNGNPVPIFEYNGTTYAPLRALAEAYGLEVGYDAASRMATVSEPTPSVEPTPTIDYSDWDAEKEAAYQEFKAMWDVSFIRVYPLGRPFANGTHNGVPECQIELTSNERVAESRESISDAQSLGFEERLAQEVYPTDIKAVLLYFVNGSYLGASANY